MRFQCSILPIPQNLRNGLKSLLVPQNLRNGLKSLLVPQNLRNGLKSLLVPQNLRNGLKNRSPNMEKKNIYFSESSFFISFSSAESAVW